MYVHGHDMRAQVDSEGSFDDFLFGTERQCDANGEDCESCQ